MTRFEEHAAMVQRYIESGKPDELLQNNLYGITHMLETVSQREREALLPILERYNHAVRTALAMCHDVEHEAIKAVLETALRQGDPHG